MLVDDPKQLTALAGRGPIQIEIAFNHISVLGVCLGNQLLERILEHKVIRLQNAHVLATRHLQAAVHRVAVAAIGLVNHLDALIACHVLANDIR